jgi:5-methylcytosine-specific restriction endonuclease McrA
MPAITPAFVKNIIRRSLREVVDPSPIKKDIHMIWDYFNSECAYCGKKIVKGSKDGHIDHLVSSSCGGYNKISNRVLSCATCNEKEKLDRPWEEFLKQKCQNKYIEEKRKSKIVQWQTMHNDNMLDKEIISKIKVLGDDVASYYDEKVKQARALRNK